LSSVSTTARLHSPLAPIAVTEAPATPQLELTEPAAPIAHAKPSSMSQASASVTIAGLTQTVVLGEKIARKPEKTKQDQVRLRSIADQVLKRSGDLRRALEAIGDSEKHQTVLHELGRGLESWVLAMEAVGDDRPKKLRDLFDLSPAAAESAYEVYVAHERARSGEIDGTASSFIERGMKGAASLLIRDHGAKARDEERLVRADVLMIEALVDGGCHKEAAFELGLLSDQSEVSRLEKMLSAPGEITSRTHAEFEAIGKSKMPEKLRAELDRLVDMDRKIEAAYRRWFSADRADMPELERTCCDLIIKRQKWFDEALPAMQKFRDSLLEDSKLTEKEAKMLAESIYIQPSVPDEVDRDGLRDSMAEFIRFTEGRTLTTSLRVSKDYQVRVTLPESASPEEALDRFAALSDGWASYLHLERGADGEAQIVGVLYASPEESLSNLKDAIAAVGGRASVEEPDNPSAYDNRVNLGNVEPDRLTQIVWHEFGHHLEKSSSEVEAASVAWRSKSAGGKGPQTLDEIFGDKAGEQTKDPDARSAKYWPVDFPDFYVGRDYPRFTEVLSVSMENFVDARRMIALYCANSSLFDYALGVARGG
jgi:hypothetical protein